MLVGAREGEVAQSEQVQAGVVAVPAAGSGLQRIAVKDEPVVLQALLDGVEGRGSRQVADGLAEGGQRGGGRLVVAAGDEQSVDAELCVQAAAAVRAGPGEARELVVGALVGAEADVPEGPEPA